MSDPFRTLTLIARALCDDAGIRLAPSTGGWAWDPRRRTILVDTGDLERTGLLPSAGIIAHECGHARVTRGSLPGGPDLPPILAHKLMNALEDRRCEAWIAGRYPGTAAWLDAARAAHRADLDDAPLYLQFMIAAADPASLEVDGVPVSMDEGVRAALAETRADRTRYRDTRPDADLTGWFTPREQGATLVHQPGEAGILASAAAALEIANGRVRAVYAALVNRDARALAQASLTNPAAATTALRSQDWRAVRLLAAGRRSPTDDEVSAALARLGEHASGCTDSPGPIGRAHRSRRHRRAADATPPDEQRADRVRGDVARLTAALEAAFPKHRPTWGRGRYETGQRPHLPSVMRLEANPRASHRVWERRTTPDVRSASVLLLVDLSGSMSNGKIEPTLDAVAMLVAALGALEIPLAVYGFQDELIEVLPFGLALAPGSKALAGRIDRMSDEVSGTAEGGHNAPGHNDDGPCLDAACRILARQPQSDRVLLVLSDGEPSGVRSGPDDLHAAVARWGGRTSPVRLVGIGIASEEVAEYYPDAVAGVQPQDLAATLGRVLARRLGAAA